MPNHRTIRHVEDILLRHLPTSASREVEFDRPSDTGDAVAKFHNCTSLNLTLLAEAIADELNL